MAYRCGRLRHSGVFRKHATAASIMAHAMYGAHINGLTNKAITQMRVIATQAMIGGTGGRAAEEIYIMMIADPNKVEPRYRLMRESNGVKRSEA